MNGMKKILTLLLAWTALAACQDDLPLGNPGGTAEGMVDIYLSGTGMPHIVTRANGQDDVDNRVDNVILFAFGEDGTLLNSPVQQSVTLEQAATTTQNARYKIRAYLPSGWETLRAVCNYDDAEGLIDKVDNESNLTEKILTINSLEDTFKGVYVMEGKLDKSEAEDKVIIPVTRTVSRHTFQISFDPNADGDKFLLGNLWLFNVPARSYLVKDTKEAYDLDTDSLTDWTGDAVYTTEHNETSHYLTGQAFDKCYTEEKDKLVTNAVYLEAETTEAGKEYTATAHLFENRRGGVTSEALTTALGLTGDYTEDQLEDIRQLFKFDLANGTGKLEGNTTVCKESFKQATCLVIEGMYTAAENQLIGMPEVKTMVRYYVYLGHNNFGDFNVVRNYDYTYDITIRSCDVIDTRISAQNVGDIEFRPANPDQPFDAHYNVREALVYASKEWSAYVEDPDNHPWLEISTSSAYKARPLGTNTVDHSYAAQRLDNMFGGLSNIYIHTDEYVPDLNENATLNGTLKPRTGKIIVQCGDAKEEFQVVQYPAQLVKVEEDKILGTGETRYFYVERILEDKYKDWGFRGFWSMELDYLISQGTYSGLGNSRREYVCALWGDSKSDSKEARDKFDPVSTKFVYKTDNTQNAAYGWGIINEETEEEGFVSPVSGLPISNKDALFNLPTSFALGYALAKNRDRNENGRIDYDEIRWYLPAFEELKAIRAALQLESTEKLYGITGTDTDKDGIPDELDPLTLDGKFWSSTPSVSDEFGITPGRAYCVDMNADPDKNAVIALRDQSYSVIVCREVSPESDENEPDSGGNGEVGLDDEAWGNDDYDTPRRENEE